jgi:hypothetical protein
MTTARRAAREQGQSTVEWVALVTLVALAMLALATLAGLSLPGIALAHAVSEKIVCAVGLSDDCLGEESALSLAYGDELADLAAAHAPMIFYEDGMKALPVDYRRCREDACADGPESGKVWRSVDGESTVAFLHVIDCRPGASGAAAAAGADCSGERTGNVYLQYWVYYPGSATGEGSIAPGLVRAVTGGASHHPDDWESYTVRIGPDGVFDRASSHHGYGSGWAEADGNYYVAGGSHAGTVDPGHGWGRITPPGRLGLIPLEPIAATEGETSFAVTPPWKKRVWTDPEYEGTD